MTTLVHHHLENSVTLFPKKIALIHGTRRLSYSKINKASNQLAHFLIHTGVIPGDRVVLLMDNCAEYVMAYYAILKAGAIAVPLSSDLKPTRIMFLMEELTPVAIISSGKYRPLFQACELKKSHLKVMIFNHSKKPDSPCNPLYTSWETALENKKTTNPELLLAPSDLASIIYTSGSSGKPKGVMLSHQNITANTASICQYLALDHRDVQMVVLPFFYVMGKSLLNTLFRVSGTVVLNNKFAFPAQVISEMIKEKVTLFSGVPSTYAHLIHRSPLKASRDQLTSLRCCTQAGGHMPGAMKRQLQQALPKHTDICIMYGATEASARLTWLPPHYLESRINSIGKAIPGVRIKILDDAGREVPPGETGELVATGNNIMQGYWKDESTTKKALDHHGYHTGDEGYMDEEGFIFLEGRKDSLIKVGGHRISPQEVEDALMETGLLMEVVVLGKADAFLGHRLVAIGVAKDKTTPARKILACCSELLPKYKLPGEIRLVRQLPKNANGKINKQGCEKLL
ncbi:Acyl-CoA synthetase (AMP-forming)/AMP-acid ligase II [Desulfocicer vacuolatum DSM 3385]|uniref:Acyl-CoA synthetase (AMP-forming)/AMP-acid ligase II n=1 Tax=Desulfocicer vacuolatum DSM 3385 TaxID=1121400 RepID=A0A1W1ZPD0_9BACT|nr:class I adenylate-forming enzyme family protein [Desulfocicer vacuolatum]SMC50113.1 Acyl-CoA synthetase (AMP-forming)/AMP-acid ligase II [Desulfocicer vacuolatum DSM 3385]